MHHRYSFTAGQMIDVALPQDVIDQIQQAMGGR